MSQIGRLWRTVRHLKWQQISGRVRFRLMRPCIDLSTAPPERAVVHELVVPARRQASMVGVDSFKFLNQIGSLKPNGWDNPELTKLWRYNQHYFDDLNAMNAASRSEWHNALIERWIIENPPPRGSGWEPYPTSLRIVNWIKFVLCGGELSDAMRKSLAIQTRWLRKRLEWHLLGNHLFANAKALLFAGLFFSGEEAETWLRTGREILREQLSEQILADGAHFELSPMYHALALEDILDLVNLSTTFGHDELAQEFALRIPAMLEWLLMMSHPDGGICFFNDAANGIAPNNIELLRYAKDLGFNNEPHASRVIHNVASGYVRMEVGRAIVIADLASVGPDYLPGHAHADTASFECSLSDKRIVVNSGTSLYGTCPERQRQRGTSAHSTLVVDGENSSEVWSGFRVGRRAKPFDIAARQDGTSLIAQCAHDGYMHLTGSPVHRREWRLSEGQLLVTDTIEGSGVHRLEAYFHLGPAISSVAGLTNGTWELRDGDGLPQAAFSTDGGIVEVISSSWHPEFGLTFSTKAIRVSAERTLPHTLQYKLVWGR